MALVIDLKPKERIIVGNAVITNDNQRTRLHIEGDAPILREKDVLREQDATSPCKRIYFIIQMMYLATDATEIYDQYFSAVREVQEAAPSTALLIADISAQILGGHYYKALREARKLIDYEQELMANV
ncbi:MAG: flagellar biosynthesis repressor FlbT [Rhodospirillales bacterium]|nr:flagellar biosynthesis repressor FlbT [Alphaproteobacteria bacterium]MCB9987121.1 flagellar biosynthesis repressor FlbT [Rhodospirillales bacterium]USO08121.1 MAG: flagellar biosynthesis repressor FlbT [Rhodospirillales bacterium]